MTDMKKIVCTALSLFSLAYVAKTQTIHPITLEERLNSAPIVIGVDPAHGPKGMFNQGTSAKEGFTEFDLNLALSRRIKDYFDMDKRFKAIISKTDSNFTPEIIPFIYSKTREDSLKKFIRETKPRKKGINYVGSKTKLDPATAYSIYLTRWALQDISDVVIGVHHDGAETKKVKHRFYSAKLNKEVEKIKIIRENEHNGYSVIMSPDTKYYDLTKLLAELFSSELAQLRRGSTSPVTDDLRDYPKEIQEDQKRLFLSNIMYRAEVAWLKGRTLPITKPILIIEYEFAKQRTPYCWEAIDNDAYATYKTICRFYDLKPREQRAIEEKLQLAFAKELGKFDYKPSRFIPNNFIFLIQESERSKYPLTITF